MSRLLRIRPANGNWGKIKNLCQKTQKLHFVPLAAYDENTGTYSKWRDQEGQSGHHHGNQEVGIGVEAVPTSHGHKDRDQTVAQVESLQNGKGKGQEVENEPSTIYGNKVINILFLFWASTEREEYNTRGLLDATQTSSTGYDIDTALTHTLVAVHFVEDPATTDGKGEPHQQHDVGPKSEHVAQSNGKRQIQFHSFELDALNQNSWVEAFLLHGGHH
jgi:hypothetical protein